MNKYIRAAYCVPFGWIKTGWTKLFHPRRFHGPLVSLISPLTEITLDYGGQLHIGNRFKMRDGAKIRVRKGAICRIGSNTSLSSNDILACRERIEIGSGVQLSPNVQIYDHDHDFRCKGGINAGKYTTQPVVIGDNVWIGANTVILKGTTVGSNSVIAAGSVVKGNFPNGSLIYQQRQTSVKEIPLSVEMRDQS